MSKLLGILRKENTDLRTRLLVHAAGIILMAAVFWDFHISISGLTNRIKRKRKGYSEISRFKKN